MNWGVPDWRDASAYPGPGDISLADWHWQFTRRRADYREFWVKHARAQYDQLRAFREYCSQTGGPVPPGEIGAFNQDFCFGTWPEVREQFRLNFVACPSLADRPARIAAIGYGGHVEWRSHDEMVKDQAAGRFTLAFDVSKPLGEQIEGAEATLRSLQQEFFGIVPERRRQIVKWPSYLRVIDGRDAGASWKELAEAVFDRQSPHLARDTHTAASRLRV